MPTVLRVKGYRLSFFSYDLNEPIHVHVTKAGCEAKIWMSPVSLAWSKGFRDVELREILAIVEENQNVIESAWNERSGN
ncbi:MAG: DUF4160 domain-containing protein [Verrucomicrobia bacterium]|nr:DUF4160 domain-containing protein [Verrucomicrobiota bacterium]